MPRQTELFEGGYAREVIEVPVTKELGESFMAYSLSVITSRAIPDVRDGLKPVQRRILHAMADMGMRPDRPHRKCANVVGETMGNGFLAFDLADGSRALVRPSGTEPKIKFYFEVRAPFAEGDALAAAEARAAGRLDALQTDLLTRAGG